MSARIARVGVHGKEYFKLMVAFQGTLGDVPGGFAEGMCCSMRPGFLMVMSLSRLIVVPDSHANLAPLYRRPVHRSDQCGFDHLSD